MRHKSMSEFNQKQIDVLKGGYSLLARSCNTSPAYVCYIIKGKRPVKTTKAKNVAKKAKLIFKILNNQSL